ncbi:SpoIIE family protein phosphatase [Leptolyngbya sp. BC1307]|uniref:PP2C family protein-serine/threonine phosphatase n=1 Tax=Leptolyngbya sp. BC1307 TaxID=2029589 RepID=UPI000EFD3812|nr:SpoIIE family protein phosphatase [Leptolyngbya sp. BC1307]
MTFRPPFSSPSQPPDKQPNQQLGSLWSSVRGGRSPDDQPSSVIDILVIDDDPIVLQSLQRLLQKRGYRVATAIDAAAGLQTAIRLTPSVIVCDWLLPGDMSGLDICHRIKQDPQLSTTAFLIMTGHTEIANRVEALEAGADDLLIKPVDTAELIARVKSGLRLHQLTQALRAQTRRLEAELAEAATYVISLLPKDTPKDTSGGLSDSYPTTDQGKDTTDLQSEQPVSIASCFISSQELGGDCFDHYWLDPNYLVMYLLDVSGHGLGAALLSTSVLNVLRSQSLPGADFYRPETVLTSLNEAFQMNGQNDKYFTIWYGVYNRETRQLAYASAGHPPALLVSPTAIATGSATGSATIERLRTPGMPVGMMPDAVYQWQRCSIAPHSRLYIFSDGVYEIQPAGSTSYAEGPLLGLDGFVQLLTRLESNHQLNLDTLIQQVSAFGGSRFEDDLSLLEINFKAAS